MVRKKKSDFNWVLKALFFTNAFFAVLLLASYLPPFVKPSSFWPLVFFALAYPIFLWINIIFLIFWLLVRWKLAFISLVVIIVGFSHFLNYFSFSNPNKILAPEQAYLRVLSYNVRNFDFFSSPSSHQPNFENRNRIFNFLKNEDFDIICFQEYIQDNSKRFRTTDSLIRFLRANNVHFHYAKHRGSLHFGVATFSSHPIINSGRVDFSSQAGNIGIYTDILFNPDTIRVYNIHLESIGLSKEDLLLFDNFIGTGPEIENLDYTLSLKRISRRIKNAAINRTEQARIISEHIDSSPHPVILAGDFNDTPFSYAYREISRNLSDAFRSGRDIGGNTHVWSYPSFRIDFLLHSKHFKAYNFRTGKQRYSDHYPISAIFAFN